MIPRPDTTNLHSKKAGEDDTHESWQNEEGHDLQESSQVEPSVLEPLLGGSGDVVLASRIVIISGSKYICLTLIYVTSGPKILTPMMLQASLGKPSNPNSQSLGIRKLLHGQVAQCPVCRSNIFDGKRP